MAITGNGMFVVTNTPSSIGGTTQVLYTRAGSFTPNSQGYLQNTAGLYLQGWLANSQGVVTPSGSSLTSLSPINVNAIGGTVTATSTASVNANLNSSQPVSTQAQDAEITTDAAWFNTTAGNAAVPPLSAGQQTALDLAWARLSGPQQANTPPPQRRN